MQELAGKAAIVTGASRGIGAAAAREFAGLGVAVVLAARDLSALEAIAAEITENGGRAIAKVCDVSRYADVRAVAESCRDEFGRIDILVNNAGTIEPIARLADSDPEQWGRAADINYKGVYHGLRAVIPIMQQQDSGVIVNISSGAATTPLEGWSHYCSSKAAALSLTQCVDKEYRDEGIRIVGLIPGAVATEMQTIIKASGINPVSRLDPSVHIPPAWVARAIAWLCTADAASLAGTEFALNTDESRRRVGLIS